MWKGQKVKKFKYNFLYKIAYLSLILPINNNIVNIFFKVYKYILIML